VDYDRATGSPVHRRLADLIASNGPVAVTEPVILEVLSGARTDAREEDLRRLLLRFRLLTFQSAVDFDGAVKIYRRCRRQGVTPSGLVDCLIAAVALRNNAVLLTADAGLEQVARVAGIGLDTPGPGK
jgi:predicted nucleic acid-binding protein